MNKPTLWPVRLILIPAFLVIPSVLMAAATPIQHEVQQLLASDGAPMDQFGRSVAVSGDTAVIGASSDDVDGADSGSAYVFRRGAGGGWSEEAKLFPGDGTHFASFGESVAISGDTAVIGAPFDDDNGLRSGSVYVYTRDAGGLWSEQAKLLPVDGAAQDQFGWSVAASGDTAVISARFADATGTDSGLAYVYTRDASGAWSEQARLTASDSDALDAFGWSVTLSGNTAMIGAPADDDDGRHSGSAYVYMRDANGIWDEQAKLLASDGAADDFFGASVAISGDTAVIGARSDADNGYQSGSAYVYRRSTGGWSEEAKLLPDDGAPGATFGWSVAVSGDRTVIGSRTDDVNGDRSGSAYVYIRDATGRWSEQAKLLPADGGTLDNFGWSVAIGAEMAMVGARNHDDNGESSGAAYVYGLDMTPIPAALQCPGDINGNGVAELVLVTQTGRVQVKDLTGHWVNGFQVAGMDTVVDTELMADIDTNEAAELVLLSSGDGGAQVRDLLTGGSLGTIPFDTGPSNLDLEVIPDQTGNGIPEIAMLSENPVTVETRDGLTGEGISSVAFANWVAPRDFDIYPDFSGNGWPELAVLGDNKNPGDSDKIEVRDPGTGAAVSHVWLGRDWRVHEQALLADLNGNGSEEVAVLREHLAMDRVNVWIRDAATGASVNFLGFPQNYIPQKLLTLTDINGNGADEVAVFGRRANGRDQKVVIKDGRTGEKLNETWFDLNFFGQDFIRCGNVNGNGAQEVAFLGQRPSDGRYKVILKDSRTAERLAIVWF